MCLEIKADIYIFLLATHLRFSKLTKLHSGEMIPYSRIKHWQIVKVFSLNVTVIFCSILGYCYIRNNCTACIVVSSHVIIGLHVVSFWLYHIEPNTPQLVTRMTDKAVSFGNMDSFNPENETISA